MFRYRAGIVLIGSLVWDVNDNRREWRRDYFEEDYLNKIKDIELPIRYGRYSSKRECPTMVLSSDFDRASKYGIGKLIPLENSSMNVAELIDSAKRLSKAEGNDDQKFIKGQNKWCILYCWFNPKIDEAKKISFLDKWKNEYREELTKDILNKFKMKSEKSCLIDNGGCLDLEFESSMSDFEILIGTQTKPRRNEKSRNKYLSPSELASQFFYNPEYFLKNKINFISTNEDKEIIKSLKKYDLKKFKKNALLNNCTEEEINKFFDKFLNI